MPKPPQKLYRDTLESPHRERYLDKIIFIDGRDPLDPSELETWPKHTEDMLPAVSYYDIVNYLVFSSNTYTKEQMRAFKGLDAYNQFLCGWVSEEKRVYACSDGNHVVVSGKVSHSQALREKKLLPWVAAKKDGVVLFTDCNCKGGPSEVCTHVAALLFAIQATVRIRDAQTVTDKPAYWKLPSEMKQVEYMEIAKLELASARRMLERFEITLQEPAEKVGVNHVPVEKPQRNVIPSEEEKAAFFEAMHATGARSAILAVISPFSDGYVPEVLAVKYPTVLSELYDARLIKAPLKELIVKTQAIFDELKVTPEQAKQVEEDTRKQSKNKRWYSFRAGRVTASKAKSVCRTKIDNPSKSLIKSICYPEACMFFSKATRWGCDHEEDASKEFLRKVAPYHEEMKLESCGLFIDTRNPHVGGTPDGVVSCKCCGTYILEVKCPYCHRYDDICESNSKCLKHCDDGKMRLDRQHAYYYQIQVQLGAAEKDMCYFVVWSKTDVHIERILFDQTLYEQICARAKQFFVTAILPEIVGKYYTRPSTEPQQPLPTSSPTPAVTATVRAPMTGFPLRATTAFCTPGVSTAAASATSAVAFPAPRGATSVRIHQSGATGTSAKKTSMLPPKCTSTIVPPRGATALVTPRGASILVPRAGIAPVTPKVLPLKGSPFTPRGPITASHPEEVTRCPDSNVTATAVLPKGATSINHFIQTKRPSDVPIDRAISTPAKKAASSQSEKKWCYCRKPEHGQMIGCDGRKCPWKWFHFNCVGILTEPEGDWFCGNCKV